MSGNKSITSIVLVGLLLLTPLSVYADGTDPLNVDITTAWTSQSGTDNDHAYLLTFSSNSTFDISTEITHIQNGTELNVSVFTTWGYENGVRTAHLLLNSTLQWADQVTVDVTVNSIDTVVTTNNNFFTRSIEVGTWNQPMADHEITLTTSWNLLQNYTTVDGDQYFRLNFDGHGWQQRIGDVLNSWELGDGVMVTEENTEGVSTNMSFVLDSIWKNETITAGLLTSQVIDARGWGYLVITSEEDEAVTQIIANVSDAWINHSMIDGINSERIRLEAGGLMTIDSTNESSTTIDIDAELSVFLFETWDENGVRKLSHNQIEALGDFIIIDDGFRMDISLDGMEILERWEDGIRTQHRENIRGHGTFGAEDQDDNATMVINGTIFNLETDVVNGQTVTDDIHIDGTLSGDVQGTFGIVKGIETSGMQSNYSGDEFEVNVIHEESWFNITGINGGNFFDGAGAGAYHNNSWNYQSVNSHWDNRTVRIAWEETGPDASSGDDKPERSPIQNNLTQPEMEQALGNITVGRETGLVPIPMAIGDNVRLNGQDGIVLEIVANSVANDPRDNHNFHVVEWTGSYGDSGDAGIAFGSIIDEGPLRGLVSSVTRSFEIEYGANDESAFLNETQYIDRVLSPSIVTAEENTDPVLVSLTLEEGLVVGEGASVAHLVAHATDDEWNIESITADLTVVGGEIVTLNDKGLSGDNAIGDDRYTTQMMVPGLEVGNFTINVTITDYFGAITEGSGVIQVVDDAPRLTSVEFVPHIAKRGDLIIVNAIAFDGHGVESVQVDMRVFGGQLVDLLLLENEVWAGNFTLPNGMTPGSHDIPFIVTDSIGGKQILRHWINIDNGAQPDAATPYRLPDGEHVSTTMTVLNTAPQIVAEDMIIIREDSTTTALLEAEVSDADGVMLVRAKLGIFTPITQNEDWSKLYDDGSNGDRVAGDGIFSLQLSIRSGIPDGTHTLLLQASDIYGEATGEVPIVVTLEEKENVITGGAGISSTMLVMALGIIAIIGAVVVMFVMRKEGGDGDKSNPGGDRFGFQ
ncbi:MAG TPA: hypothetical protein EYQ58_00105 [Candidatus Poseidoniales archaeon]|nr:hypothetical protein [Candidatus Poseidoniales archaeon]